MEKRADIGEAVRQLIGDSNANGRARIGILMSRDDQVPRAVADMGHRVVVVGDRFKPLYHFVTHNRQYNPVVAVEARYDALPLGPEGVDTLIVARPMPRGSDIVAELQRFRQYLSPGGTLMWVHPLYEGFTGRIQRFFSSRWYRMERHVLCRIAMEQGFCQIGQELVRGRRARKYVLTRATIRS